MSSEQENNAVLEQLWNDSDVQQLTRTMREIFPNTIAANEVIVDDDHLTEAGYVGKRPRMRIGLGRWSIYRGVASYQDYWIRFYTKTETTYLYSIFKES